MYDGGVAKRKSQALKHRELAVLRQRCEAARQVVLQVRQGWLQLRETQNRITVALSSLRSADENLKVTRDRYSKGVGTNTEVLDAESLRLQSFTNYFNAVYDAALANFQLPPRRGRSVTASLHNVGRGHPWYWPSTRSAARSSGPRLVEGGKKIFYLDIMLFNQT